MSGSSKVRLLRANTVWVARSCMAAFLSALLATGYASAGDECQEIQLDGVAGSGGGTVVIRVVDARPEGVGMDPIIEGQDVISESCALEVAPNESAAEFIRRVPGFWGGGLPGGTPLDNVCQRKCTAGKGFEDPNPAATPNPPVCTVNAACDVLPGDDLGICGEQPKKECGNIQETGRSCKIEAKVTQVKGKCDAGISAGKSCSTDSQCPGSYCPGANTLEACEDPPVLNKSCTKKRTIKICCRETPLCKGAKLDGPEETLPNIPITVQTKLSETSDCAFNTWCPTEIPGDNTQALRFKADPIDGRPGPYASQRECRAALQTATGSVTLAVVDALKACRKKVLEGTLSAGSCDAVDSVSDPNGLVAAASSALHADLTDDCQASGQSPSDFGYTTCPPPCGSIDLKVCSAPVAMVGNACLRDRHCDTNPGDGDGVCGDWSSVEDCAVCGSIAVGITGISAGYGVIGSAASEGPGTASEGPRAGSKAARAARAGGPGPSSLAAPIQICQNHIGDSIAALLAVELKDAAKCQKSLDTFKIMLSDRTPKCKDADHKHKRAKARAAIALDLAVFCDNAALGELDTCASNMLGLANCVPRIARRLAAAVADIGAPEGRCGDSKKGIGEKCDDGNTIDGDGCDSNCTLTACGNGVVTAGEQCDDGNTISGDGCSPTCTGDPCAPQMCGTYTNDCSASFPGDCLCLRNAEGGGSCVGSFNCATAAPCNNSSECAPGERCYLDTCCTGPGPTGVCGPQTCTEP